MNVFFRIISKLHKLPLMRILFHMALEAILIAALQRVFKLLMVGGRDLHHG
jgi:hypothetical protein